MTFRHLSTILKVEKNTGRQSVRGRGGVIAVPYETRKWTSSSLASRLLSIAPALGISIIKLTSYAVGCESALHYGKNLEVTGERCRTPGYGCMPRAEWRRRYITTALLNGENFWYKVDDGLNVTILLGNQRACNHRWGVYSARCGQPVSDQALPPARCTTSTGTSRHYCCLQSTQVERLYRTYQSNVD